MADFVASLGPFGWLLIGLFVFAIFTAPKAFREYWQARQIRRGQGRTDGSERDRGE